ncbi:DUF262 domain-containing protein [Mariniflexile jejuense]|uniref:DUF262 domain-containing protein n=1 Tax=Mariniflexile jejuense TaxID=1173582 RepID=A0ABW3JKT4_9FLAO
MHNSNEITPFSINEIFKSGEYSIPIYQRNYAWREGQIVQLINDVNDFAISKKRQNYYIGTLVVYKRKKEDNQSYYETIDGQQRLTTLNILYAVLKNTFNLENELPNFKKTILEFENRITSSNALELAYKGKFDDFTKYNTTIKDAYQIIEKELKSLFKISDNLVNDHLLNFVNYLNNHVVILRVEVPKDTDLNHYFEIMNNRGEQLEKHEVLKSLLLSYLENIENKTEKDITKMLFTRIWDGCSQMERYIQYAFDKNHRQDIFGKNWNTLNVENFDDLLSKFREYETLEPKNENSTSNNLEPSLRSIIKNTKYSNISNNSNQETSERFNSVINFQNFLLHCLLIFKEDNEFKLDDKKLISNFEFLKSLSNELQIRFVKNFAFCILKTKFLLDNYVIKREFISNTEGWSLKKLHFYNDKSQSYIGSFGTEENESDNRNLIWLLSMFHTVAPNMMYKHWLNAALKYLYTNYSTNGIDSSSYINYLEGFAKQLVFNRFLNNNQKEYFDIIYGEKDENFDENNLNWNKLKYSTIENNLIFNYIDYLLIKSVLNDEIYDVIGLKSFVSKFEFTFRSSVEHYYPQNPKEGFDKLNYEDLHSVGNLTLISHSKNSAMNNYMPKAKKEHYKNGAIADSVKQYLMFNKYPDNSWGSKEIKAHEIEIIELLKSQLNHHA